jgi:ADP-ribose pyrophosphatase
MEEKAKKQQDLELQAKTETQLVYEGRIISLQTECVHLDDRSTKKTDVILHPGAVGILPVHPSGKLVLIKQWRRAVKKIIIEIPAGTLEKNEHAIDCAQRELQEETGFKANTMIPIGGFYTAPGFCTEFIHLFLAKDLEESPLYGDDCDEIDLMVVGFDEAMTMVDTNVICDAKTIAALGLYPKMARTLY